VPSEQQYTLSQTNILYAITDKTGYTEKTQIRTQIYDPCHLICKTTLHPSNQPQKNFIFALINPIKKTMNLNYFFSNGSTVPWGPRLPLFLGLHDHTFFRLTTFVRTPLDEGSARCRDLYLTTHNTHKRQTSMPPMGYFSLSRFFL
jgi:hypothetical protein